MTSRSAILTHRLTYQTIIRNISGSPLTNIRVFVAFPPPFPPFQKVLEITPSHSTCQQATDVVGNNWLDISLGRLTGNESFTCGYTALVQNRSAQYQLPSTTRNPPIPSELQRLIKPEYFIESHHHLIKDLARDIAKDHTELVPFIRAAMQTVSKILRYAPQRDERGAAYAIENRVGDCTEFSALFAALCRVQGIPSRLISGFASSGKKWERHGWSEVWIQGNWIPVDPTWFGSIGWIGITNQHIPMIIGNWMDIRSNQEFKVSWTQQPNAVVPRLSSTWRVIKVMGFLSS